MADIGTGGQHEGMRAILRPHPPAFAFLPRATIAWAAAPLALSLPLAVLAAQAAATAPDSGPEIIAGQARTPPPSRAPASKAEAPADFHAKALAPLPAQSYPRKPRRARKHRLDEDRDGFISRSEFEAEHQARAAAFRMADANQDGKLDADEMRRYQALMQTRSRRR